MAAWPVATLDLHGCTAAEAERRVDGFLRQHTRSSPGEVIEIITGKGTRSEGRPVLPGLVRECLDGRWRRSVSDWAGTPGGGSVKVRLRGRRRGGTEG
ncbi:Smr/MutS family protein [Gaopeijia maritima]|uniref:Smr/MutS family protein n=1 Tax=Gaopeijia maritima TaxID=3119007 RepID=A0ABU9E7R9_9BACT